MYQELKQRNLEKEIANRPIYIEHYTEAKEKHMKGYFELLEALITKE
jgi:hypothetical protein